MSQLLRASSLIGRPVVTLTGESPLEIKDVVFNSGAGEILGFTLRKHGFFGGPAKEDLPWADGHGLGPDAVIVADESALTVDHSFSTEESGDVMGNQVMSENGTEIGQVVEVIVSSGATADVVGFEIEASENLRDDNDRNLFLPLPETLAISGERIIVPDSAVDYVKDDLAGFGGAVADFRSQLEGTA